MSNEKEDDLNDSLDQLACEADTSGGASIDDQARRNLANRIHETICNHNAIQLFRDRIFQWSKERQEAKQIKQVRFRRSPTIRERWKHIPIVSYPNIPLPLVQGKAPSLLEKFAILGAIHDREIQGVELIWPEEPENSNTTQDDILNWLKERSTFSFLMSFVPDLKENDLLPIETYLADVKAVLEAIMKSVIDEQNKPNQKNSKSSEGLGIEERALAVLMTHPDWTDIEIAKAVGCSRTTLYSYEKFKSAKALLKSNKSSLPKGHKSSNGDIEAYDIE